MSNIFSNWATFYELVSLFISVGIIIVISVANWFLFKKVGKKGWEAIMPFYNTFVLVEIVGLNWWWFLLSEASELVTFMDNDLSVIASLVNLVVKFNCYYNLARKFGKSKSTSVLAGIFSSIFIFIFAFSSKEKYYAKKKVGSNGIFSSTDDTKKENTDTLRVCLKCGCKVEDNYKFCPTCGEKIE